MAPGEYATPEAEPLPSPIAAAKSYGSISEDEAQILLRVGEVTQESQGLQTAHEAFSQRQPKLSVLDHTLVTSDFHALQFEAAAFGQLALKPSIPKYSPLLVASPYNCEDQLLDLRTLDTPDRLFALALTCLTPPRPDYATAPYIDALNWEPVLAVLRGFARAENFEWKEQSFYVVIFRSKLKEVVDRELLHLLDQKSHVEATASGGLLKYWFGDPDLERRNLATCLWRSKEDARLGGLGPWHKKARSAARDLYESITFSSHRFTIKDGVTGWSFEEWEPKGTEVPRPHAPLAAEPSCDRTFPPADLVIKAAKDAVIKIPS